MINPYELRIGNWVNDGGTCNYKIALDTFGNNDFEKMKPIPLTNEILEKIGQRKTILGSTVIHWQIGFFLFSERDFEIKNGLHFLQNWYYFKTNGEEIEINL